PFSHLVRVVQTSEKADRIGYAIDSEIERINAAVVDPDTRTVRGGVGPIRGEGEINLLHFGGAAWGGVFGFALRPATSRSGHQRRGEHRYVDQRYREIVSESHWFRSPRSAQYLEPVEPEKILVGLQRTPSSIGVMIKHRKANLLYRALFSGSRRAGVIDNPVSRAFGRAMRLAQEDHHMVRISRVSRFVKEQQVAGLRLSTVARNKSAVVVLQRSPIPKLRELSLREVVRTKCAEV